MLLVEWFVANTARIDWLEMIGEETALVGSFNPGIVGVGMLISGVEVVVLVAIRLGMCDR
jgi:hypothetical protein